MTISFLVPCSFPFVSLLGCKVQCSRRPRLIMSSTGPKNAPFIVRNANGISLSCLLDEAPNHEAPLYVLVHGFRDSKNGRFISNLAFELHKRGAQTCRFDCTGNGGSGGHFQYANYRSEAEDLRAVVEYLRSEGRNVAGVAGHSKGGGVVLIYAQKYADVEQVVALAPRYVMNVGIEERFGKKLIEQVRVIGKAEVINSKDGFKFFLTRDSLLERESLNMGEVARDIPENVEVVIVHGSKDEIIPVTDADKFDRDIKNSRKVIVEGADHGFRGVEKKVADAFFCKESNLWIDV